MDYISSREKIYRWSDIHEHIYLAGVMKKGNQYRKYRVKIYIRLTRNGKFAVSVNSIYKPRIYASLDNPQLKKFVDRKFDKYCKKEREHFEMLEIHKRETKIRMRFFKHINTKMKAIGYYIDDSDVVSDVVRRVSDDKSVAYVKVIVNSHGKPKFTYVNYISKVDWRLATLLNRYMVDKP